MDGTELTEGEIIERAKFFFIDILRRLEHLYTIHKYEVYPHRTERRVFYIEIDVFINEATIAVHCKEDGYNDVYDIPKYGRPTLIRSCFSHEFYETFQNIVKKLLGFY